MNEPTVLDYVKSKLFPWKYGRVELPDASPPHAQVGAQRALTGQDRPASVQAAPSPAREEIGYPAERIPPVAVYPVPQAAEAVQEMRLAWPWRGLGALLLALAAQLLLEPNGERSWQISALLYVLAAGGLVWSYLSREWQVAPLPAEPAPSEPGALLRHPPYLTLSLPLTLAAFVAFGGNRFTLLNTALWLASIALFLAAFWQAAPPWVGWREKTQELLSRRSWAVTITPWALALLGLAALALYFRLHNLDGVPPQMNSDHAEKLLDVQDVLAGRTGIFFLRNTGREFFQFYLTAAVIRLFGTGVTFLSLKIGTAIAGLVTLVYIYLLGKEIANREVGLWATAFAAVAYWPNVITRVALRFSLYPLFVAPVLYHLFRGIRRSSLNDFLLAGLFLGLGLHGYSSFRIVPFVVTAAVLVYLLHRESRGERQETLLRFVLLAAAAFLVFLPLLRYALENPEMFAYRAFTRLGSWERPLPGPAWLIFAQNLWNSWVMFFWDNGEIWLHSIPHRPALSIVAAALYFMGTVLLLLRYLRSRRWLDLFLLLSVPLLMLPSILSLAFPAENPSLNRTAGAIVPVFLILGFGLESLTRTLRSRLSPPFGPRLAWAAALVLLLGAAAQDYGLIFDRYFRQYSLASWNSSEMGAVLRDFAETVGTRDTAWVVSYPHWVDTRLVGIEAGFPQKNYELLLEDLDLTQAIPEPKLFLVNPEDTEAQASLSNLYPQGWFTEYVSTVESKNFLIFFVPLSK